MKSATTIFLLLLLAMALPKVFAGMRELAFPPGSVGRHASTAPLSLAERTRLANSGMTQADRRRQAALTKAGEKLVREHEDRAEARTRYVDSEVRRFERMVEKDAQRRLERAAVIAEISRRYR